MNTRVDFFGPVELYVREEDGEYVAWAEPFSEFGAGATIGEAIAAAQKSVEDYLSLVAMELHDGNRVRFKAKLSDEEKAGATVLRFNLCAVRVIVEAVAPAVQPESKAAHPEPITVKPLEEILDVLPEGPSVHATPACAV